MLAPHLLSIVGKAGVRKNQEVCGCVLLRAALCVSR